MKIGRNDPCPCGSGHKYKKCCLNKVLAYTFLVTTNESDTFRCQIRLTSDDTLCSLHDHLQEALDWDNDHMFSFFMDNKLWSRKAEYSANPLGEGNADICLKNILKQKEGQNFLYLFDYGDEHCFEIEVIKAEKINDLESLIVGVVEKHGVSPLQYEYFDDDDELYIADDRTEEDGIVTDLEMIEELSCDKMEENWKFRSFLKMYDGDVDIDELIHRIVDNISDQIDCTECANCCKKISPILVENDIVHLSSSLSLEYEDFKERYLKEDDNSNLLFKTSPCLLLKDNKCTKYSCRPDDCRSFPHLHKKDFLTRLWGTVENYSICPIVFNSYEMLKKEFHGWQHELIY